MDGLEDVAAASPPIPTYSTQVLLQNPQDQAPQQNLPVDLPYAPDQRSTEPFPPVTPTQQPPSYYLTETAPFQPQPQPQPQPATQPYAKVHGPPAFTPQPPVPPQPSVPLPQPQQRYRTPATNSVPSVEKQSNQSQPPLVQTVFDQEPAPQDGVWTTGIFDCFKDPNNAIVTACFPCVTFGQVAEIVDEGRTSCYTSGISYCMCCLCPWTLTSQYRTRLRVAYHLPDIPAPDCLTHFFCDCCAICQEYRELRNRGQDPGLRWNGNVIRARQQQTSTVPPVNQTMRT